MIQWAHHVQKVVNEQPLSSLRRLQHRIFNTRERVHAMRTQSADTSPEMERVQIELLRKAPITQKFAMVESWSQFILEASRQGIRREYPEMSEEEVALILVARQFGQPFAEKIRAVLIGRRQQGRCVLAEITLIRSGRIPTGTTRDI